jgi:hypothetical protein
MTGVASLFRTSDCRNSPGLQHEITLDAWQCGEQPGNSFNRAAVGYNHPCVARLPGAAS